ncbi:MAG TPA: flippase-like domain-containing protein [Thermoplasmatales archaeon]|nr:flippase-like domain-containing protein [Thermoplasmatales archaeon]
MHKLFVNTKKRSILLRIMISITLLFIIIYTIGFERIKQQLSHTIFWFFLLALLLENFGVMISAKKWQMLLHDKKIEIPYMDSLSYYYIGSFFNTMMPSSVGGDVIKAYMLGKKADKINVFSSVIMDRLTGLIAVIFIAVLAVASFFSLLPQRVIPIILLIVVFFFISLLLLIKTSFFERLVDVIFRRWKKARDFFYEIIMSLKRYKNKKLLLSALLISLLFHLLMILNNFVLSISIGAGIPLIYFFIFVPIAELLVALPISIQGFGVREGSYAILFSSVGASYAAAFSIGFLDQIVKVVVSITGGIIYVLKK